MNTPYLLLLESEKMKKEKTEKAVLGFYSFIPHVYNVFMKLPFYVGKLADDDDENMIKIQDTFQFFIYDFPFKIRNIFSLMEIGSYADAAILFRSCVESFICYKYYILKKDGDGLSKYTLRQSKRSIKDIFEDVIPGYYDGIYAELCYFTHGNPLTQALFRGNVSKEEPLKTDINNININYFGYVLNQLLPLILGAFDLYSIVFPNNTAKKDSNLNDDWEAVCQFIQKDISDRKAQYPEQSEMIDCYNKIIKV